MPKPRALCSGSVNNPGTLGRYRLERVLGRGAMGVVYEGFDPRLGRKVAVKTILHGHLDPQTASDYAARFEREAQAVARLNHPNIVHVHDFGQEGDTAYLVMEFVDGKELKSFFDAKHQFELRDAVRIMCELCDALDFAHQAGVVHRDIKPGNVMLDAQRRVKLTDFGVAKIHDVGRSQVTHAGTMVGTPAYMSPEQISGGTVDRRSDVFSAGIVLYQFLTGSMPFGGGGAWTIAKRIMQDEPPPPTSLNAALPPQFDAVVRKALAKKPAHRYASAAEFAAALREALRNHPAPQRLRVQADERAWRDVEALARQQDELEKLAAQPTRKKPYVAAASFAALLTAIAVAYVVTRPHDTPVATDQRPDISSAREEPPAKATKQAAPPVIKEPAVAETEERHASLRFFASGASTSPDGKHMLEATDAYLRTPLPAQQERIRRLAESGTDFAALAILIRQLGIERKDALALADRLVKNNFAARLQKLASGKDDLAIYWLARLTFEQTAALVRLSSPAVHKERMLVLDKLIASANRGYVPAQIQMAIYTSYWFDDEATLIKNLGGDPRWFKSKWVGNVRKTLPGVIQVAETGFVSAQSLLAHMYHYGREDGGNLVVAKDRERAMAWYERAITQGAPEDFPAPSIGLATLLLEGEDAARQRGLGLLTEAGAMGSTWAKVYLAYLYANGRGVARNLPAAQKYLVEAARLEARLRSWGSIDLLPPMDHRIGAFGMRVPPEFDKSEDLGIAANVFATGGRIAIKQAAFEGNTVFSQSRLRQMLALSSDGTYDANALFERLIVVRGFHRQRGYFLTQLYAPKQDARSGALRVIVLEGRIEKVTIEQPKDAQCMPPGLLEAYFAQLLPANALISEHALESALMPIHDGLPCTITTALDPGSKVGFSSFKVNLSVDRNSALR